VHDLRTHPEMDPPNVDERKAATLGLTMVWIGGADGARTGGRREASAEGLRASAGGRCACTRDLRSDRTFRRGAVSRFS
jgi:hypothetical protein